MVRLKSFSSNNWAVGDYYQFQTSTSVYHAIQVSWDQTGSGTGPRDFKLAYSTDGTNFTDFYSYSLPSPAVSWSSTSTSSTTKFSSDLSSITALDNKTNVYFRLIDTSTVSISGGTVGTGGTGRVDNFTVSGIGPTPPSGVGAATPYALLPGDSTLLTVAVTPGEFPITTGHTVTCDLTAVGGSATQAFLDNGVAPDVAIDNTFSYAATVSISTTAGAKSLPCTINDNESRPGSATIALTIVPAILPIGTINGVISDTTDAPHHLSPYVPTGSSQPYYGQYVTIQGVIYEKTLQLISNSSPDTYKGFFIQNTSSTADIDPNTSDGLFAFMNTNSTIPGPTGAYTPQVGDEVVLYGQMEEYYNMTEMGNLAVVRIVRSGVVLDTELAPFVANPPANLADANRYWERRQGMRGQVSANGIVLNGRNVFSPADAEIWVARADSTIALRVAPYERRAFRDAHILDDNYNATTWDGNGYRIVMGSLGVKYTAGDAQALLAPARTFDTVTNAPVGGVNYSFSKYRIEVTTQPVLSNGVDPAANNPPQTFDRSLAYSIVDYNLENLYDFRNNPFSGCDFTGDTGCPKVAPFLAAVNPPYDYVPASDAVYQARLTDISLQIINDLHNPDILMVQEVENQDICSVTDGSLVCGVIDNADGKPDVLQELALKIATNGGPAYDASFDRNSSDLRGIAPAFLYRTDRVQLLPPAGDPILGTDPAIAYPGATVPSNSDVSNPKTLNAVLPVGFTGACEIDWVFPRAPDIALFRIFSTSIGMGTYHDVYVINNHFKSGPDSCVGQRTEQAKYNAAIVQFIQAANPDARIVVGGDLNVYPRPDDPFAPIGQPTSSDQLGSLYDPGLGLTNLWEVLLGQAPESAYSYVYLGMAQTLDQMFINGPMLEVFKQFRIAHINSDFPAEYSGDVARGTSDHDPQVAIFDLPYETTTLITADTPDPSGIGQNVSVTATVTGLPAGAPTPTGTVTITGGVAPCLLTLVSGTGSCDITFDTSGAKIITAVYNPTGNFFSSSDTENHTVDETLPFVVSSLRADANPTGAASVDFTVTFSQSVTGVDASDFTLFTTGVTGASISSVSGSGKTYTVTVNTGSGNGTIRLDVIDDDSIIDGVGTPLGGVGLGNGDFSSGETYTIIKIQTFADVPLTHWALPWIERLYNAGITNGCSASPLMYCPDDPTTRAQMAIFLERGMNGSAFIPPIGTGLVFSDVPTSYWAVDWIEKLYADGITNGCGTSPLVYCPDRSITRAEMAIFLLRAEHGPAYTPPAATGTIFTDVPEVYWAAAWIEQLAAEGITNGCGGGLYCPDQPVTRGEMAKFLVITFNLPKH